MKRVQNYAANKKFPEMIRLRIIIILIEDIIILCLRNISAKITYVRILTLKENKRKSLCIIVLDFYSQNGVRGSNIITAFLDLLSNRSLIRRYCNPPNQLMVRL